MSLPILTRDRCFPPRWCALPGDTKSAVAPCQGLRNAGDPKGTQSRRRARKTFALTLTHNHNNLSFLGRKVSWDLTHRSQRSPGVRAAAGWPASSAGRAAHAHLSTRLGSSGPPRPSGCRPAACWLARHTSACPGRTRRGLRTERFQSGLTPPAQSECCPRTPGAPLARTRARGHAAAPSGAARRCAARAHGDAHGGRARTAAGGRGAALGAPAAAEAG